MPLLKRRPAQRAAPSHAERNGAPEGAASASRGALTGSRMRVPRPGLVYLLIMTVLLVGSMIGRSNMLMLVFALMAGPFVLNGWVIYSMLRRMRIARRLPRRAMAGEPVFVEITLANHKRLLSSWLIVVTDAIRHREEHLKGTTVFSRVPPRDERTGRYEVRLMRRGLYRFGPLYVSTRFPLGLVERGRSNAEGGELLVHPRIGRLAPSWRREQLLAAELVQRRQRRQGVFDDEFHALRDYRWGDNPRAIHWRTSARRNELQVREFHQSRDQDLVVLLDLWQPKHADMRQRERVELAVSFAATVCVEQIRESRDSQLSLAVAGKEFETWRGKTSRAGIEPLLDVLAVVQAHAAADLPSLFDSAPSRLSPRARTVLITTRERSEGTGDVDFGLQDGVAVPPELQIVVADPRELAAFFEIPW